MGPGWVYGNFGEGGQARMDFMDTNMPIWLGLLGLH